MTETIIHIVDGSVVLNPEPRPVFTYLVQNDIDSKPKHEIRSLHDKALTEWKKNCIPCENAHVSQHPIEGYDEITILKPVFQIVTPGQKVLAEGNVVKKIL